MIVRATATEVAAIRAQGLQAQAIAEPRDFPGADANYHNYAEMVADVQAVASDVLGGPLALSVIGPFDESDFGAAVA